MEKDDLFFGDKTKLDIVNSNSKKPPQQIHLLFPYNLKTAQPFI